MYKHRREAQTFSWGLAGSLVILMQAVGCSGEPPTNPLPPNPADSVTFTLDSVSISPKSVALFVDSVQTFTQLGYFTADTSATAVFTSDTLTITYSATGGNITQQGVYTAGQTPGSYIVVADHDGSSQSDTADVTITTPPQPGATPDPTLLPVAAAQLPNLGAYQALNVPGASAGFSYQDPLTGVTVWKGTDASTPSQNTGGGHDYGDGPVQVSRELSSGVHTILIRGDGFGYHIADFTHGSGFSNYRALPQGSRPNGDLKATFSNNPATPHILFVFNGTELVRFNTLTMQQENTGNFPKALGQQKAWLQNDMNDEWFVKSVGGDDITAWNSQTGTEITRTFANLDEPHLERNGNYVAVIHGGDGTTIWDLNNNTISPYMPRQVAPFFHVASPRNAWIGTNVDQSAPWTLYRIDPTTSSQPSPVYLQNPSFGTLFHFAGQWIQTDQELGGNLLNQWILAGVHNWGPDVNTPVQGQPGQQDDRALLQAAVGFFRIDGSDSRVLAHTYQLRDNGDYWELPRATISPDGHIVLFDSDMLNSGRADLFVVEVPRN